MVPGIVYAAVQISFCGVRNIVMAITELRFPENHCTRPPDIRMRA